MSKKDKEESRFDALFGAVRQPQTDPESQPAIEDSSAAEPIAKGKDPNYQRTTIYLPKVLHRKFKAAAVGADREMSDIVEELIEQWLKSNA